MSECVRGCRVARRHVPPCTCTVECPDHDGHCSGCQPREATRGMLDQRCSDQLRDRLGVSDEPDLRWAWDHLALAYPSLTQWAGTGAPSGPQDREAERLASVVALRADIRDWIAGQVADLAERTGRAGPAGIEWTTDYRARVGKPTIGQDRAIVRDGMLWLLRNIESLEAGTGTAAADEAVRTLWEESAELMTRAHALAPWRPAPTRIDGIPCRCGALRLYDHGDEVRCEQCGEVMNRERYRVVVKVWSHQARQRPDLMERAALVGWKEPA